MIANIKGFDNYDVSSDGYIINKVNGYILKGNKKKTGYIEVCIKDNNGVPHFVLVHRVVAEAFCTKPRGNYEVNHIDGNKHNNNYLNLEWVEHNDNLKHAFINGLREDDVSAKKIMATDMNTGKTVFFNSIYQAAKTLGISQGNICMCCQNKRPYANGYYWQYVN